MTDADYADDLALFTNTHAQAESLLHSLALTSFKHEVAISTLSGKPLKLVDQFTYLTSYISFTESDVNIPFAKVWTGFWSYRNLISLIK